MRQMHQGSAGKGASSPIVFEVAVRRMGLIVTLLTLLGPGAWPKDQNTASKAKAPLVPPACPAKFDDDLQKNGVAPQQAPDVTPPRPKVSPEAEFSDEARKAMRQKHLKYFNAVSELSMIVDEDGVPRDVCLRQAGGYGLDAQAAKAAGQYRFEPATHDGKPVAKRVEISVGFRMY
jgi:outer membrane biosynthesis protein TonB